MILHEKRKRPATILSEDSVSQTAVGTVWEEIREALERSLRRRQGTRKDSRFRVRGAKEPALGLLLTQLMNFAKLYA